MPGSLGIFIIFKIGGDMNYLESEIERIKGMLINVTEGTVLKFTYKNHQVELVKNQGVVSIKNKASLSESVVSDVENKL